MSGQAIKNINFPFLFRKWSISDFHIQSQNEYEHQNQNFPEESKVRLH